jgi:hypothetical protein
MVEMMTEKNEGEIAPCFHFWCGCVNVAYQLMAFIL